MSGEILLLFILLCNPDVTGADSLLCSIEEFISSIIINKIVF